jgi:hypothetical protein
MPATAEPRTITVEADGWRFFPWGWRICAIGLFALLFLFGYGLLGPSATIEAALPIFLIPAIVVVPMDVYFELLSQRSVTVVQTGAVFDYPIRKSEVSWDHLRWGQNQPPGWTSNVMFLEVNRKSGFHQLAHSVTREQAKAILARMPVPPTDPRALKLMGA